MNNVRSSQLNSKSGKLPTDWLEGVCALGGFGAVDIGRSVPSSHLSVWDGGGHNQITWNKIEREFPRDEKYFIY